MMNKVYRIIWNSALGLWVVASELGRGKTKSATTKALAGVALTSSTSLCDKAYRLIWSDLSSRWIAVPESSKGKSYGVKGKLQGMFVAGSLAFLASAANATDITATTYTPSNANNGAKAIAVGSDTVNLNGALSWSGATGVNSAYYNLTTGYNAGYVTGGIDPNGQMNIFLSAQTNAVSVYDPVTQSNVIVNTFVSSRFTEQFATNSFYVYGPSQAGGGPFISSQIANVTGGGVFNMNASGTVGNPSIKNTTFVEVTNGTANWNSANTIVFAADASAVTPAQLQPYSVNQQWTSYTGSFTVTTTDGSQTQVVTDLASFQAYNTWLIQQLQAGKLGAGLTAQTAYNNAIALAYSNTSYSYNINPQSSPISGSDPLLVPVGTQIGMLANGPNATGNVTSTGLITVGNAYAKTAIALSAQNGGTIINDGSVDGSGGWIMGMSASAGGHIINNGVRNSYSYTPDRVADAGSTYVNNGTVNIRPSDSGYWLDVMSGSATNHGAVNIGTVTSATNNAYGVRVLGAGSYTNDTDGLMYIGREASTIVSGDPLSRGGADVSLGNGSVGIYVLATGANVDNKGTIIIGDGVQKGYGIQSIGAYTNRVVNSGTIEVHGHYNDMPSSNIGMYSSNSSASSVFNNAGTINLTGINVIGLQAKSSGKAQSSGTINVINGIDEASLLRNYGIWSEGSGSLVNLSGTVNLAGDGAIGVHARSLGNVTTSGNGRVVFSSGTKQIGYFAYGPGATITNTGTGTQDVSTEGSTLFRMEDGADFTGGTGASSILTASGKNSTAMVVTGLTGTDVSAFNSGGMTINTTGENAVAVLVEGGAQGKIASTATINLTGAGSVAGVVDGQKHTLDGSVSGTPIAGTLSNGTLAAGAAGFGTGTLLVAQANLNSALDTVTGYIAKNSASFSNSGNIIFTGKKTTGIQVLEGSTGGNSGSITIQDGSVGLSASSTGVATTLNNTGNLVLKGGTNADRTTGISATGSAVTVNMSAGTIDMQGQGAVGVSAITGAKVNLTGTSAVAFAAENTGITDQIAFLVSGAGSNINTNTSGAGLVASGKNSTLIRLENGATQSGVLSMGATGSGSRGIWATGTGTSVTALSGSTFNVGGDNAMAVLVQGGAEVDLKAGTIVNLTGTNTTVGTVDGNEYGIDGVTVLNTNTGSKLISDATLNSTTAGATGFITQNLGILTNNGSINFQGANSQAVKVLNGTFVNTANISANGTAVYVEGAQATVQNNGGAILATDGKAAVELGAGASLNLIGSGVNTVEGQGTAHAVLVDSGAAGLTVSGAHLIVNAAGASGNGIENAGDIAGIQLNNTTIDVMNGKGVRTSVSLDTTNSGTINVAGSGTGLAFETATGGVVANLATLDMSDSKNLVINLNGTGGTGILANTADGATVKTGTSVNVNNTNGGSALVVNNSAKEVIQSGNLISSSTTDAVVKAEKAQSFTNTGKIIANSVTAEAMSFNGAINTVLLNDTGAEIQGVVAMNGGENNVTNKGLITGTLSAADGDNTFLFEDGSVLTGSATLGQGNNQVTLNGTAHTDQVTAGNGTNTFTIKGTGATYNLLDGGLGAQDSLIFDAATHTIAQASKLQNFESVKLKNQSTVTLQEALILTDGGTGAGTVDIETGSEMAIKPTVAGDFAFDPLLTGKGLLSVELDADTSAFDFTTNVGNQFAGTAKLGLSQFDLSGLNTNSLTAATLQTDSGNITTVGTGVQNIGGLTMNGGTLVFGTIMPGDIESKNSIVTSAAGTLDIRGSGTVQVTMPTEVINDIPSIDSRKSLFEQDDETTLVKLVTAKGSVLGNGSAITLKDENGNLISNAQTFDINQNGTVVAEGSYDYKLLNGDGNTVDGLYIGYGLTQLDLQGTAADALILTPNTGATGKATDLSAKIIGTGDLAVEAGTQTVSLSNQLNDYSGSTTVRNGTLVMANDNVLGQTANLSVESGATFNTTDGTGNYSQTVGALNTVAGASVILAEGSTLTISDTQRTAGVADGGTIANSTLTGAGELNVAASELVVNGANAGYTGDVTLSGSSLATLDGAQGLGTQGTINLATANDRLDININPLSGNSSDLSKSLAGNGVVTAQNVTDLTLSGDNAGFNGVFSVETDAALRASEQKHLGSAVIENEGIAYLTANTQWELENSITGAGALVKQGSDRLIINHDLAYTGDTTIENGTMIIGDTAGSAGGLSGSTQVNVLANSTLSGLGDIIGAVNNQGTIAALNSLTGYESTAASNLNVGSLTNVGTIQLAGSEIGNSLTVNGNYTGGGTLVINTALGNDSSATDKLIITGDTSGDTGVVVNNIRGAGDQTVNGIEVVKVGGVSNGSFTLNSRAVAGAYEYFLNKGGVATPNDGNWYLRSQLPSPDPIDPVDPVNPIVNPTPTDNIIRPEAGSYMANMAAASKLFNLRLEDREGRAENSSMWLRQQGDRTKFRDSTGQIKTATNTYVIQGGGEVAQTQFTDTDRLGLGLMLGYGKSDSESGNSRSGYNSQGTVDGYSGGVYATWYQDAKTLNGLYVDSWVQYSMLNAEVHGDQLSGESYDMNGLSASVESGYRIPVYQSENGQVFVTPQAQITWNGIKADDHTEANGTRVSSNGDNNVQTRLGVKLSRDGVSDADKGTDKLFTVYAEANWLHNTEQAGATMDGVTTKQAGSTNVGELKLGAEGQLNKQVNLWTNVAQQMGDKGYSDTALTVGFKYKF